MDLALAVFQTLVRAGWTVIVMSDRGLYARWLFQEIVALGWHHLMRITRTRQIPRERIADEPSGHGICSERRAAMAGTWCGLPERRHRRRFDCTLWACWEFGYDEPWFVLTDLEPDQSDSLWYGMRAWIEQGFKLPHPPPCEGGPGGVAGA